MTNAPRPSDRSSSSPDLNDDLPPNSNPDSNPDSKASDRPWWRLREKTSVLGIRTLLACHRAFGRTPFRAVLAPVLLFYWSTSPEVRRASLEWLDRARPEARPAGHREGLAHLARFAETILDKFAVQAGNDPDVELIIEGDEPFRNDPPNRGCIILTSHAGCQELLSREAGFHTEHPIVVLQHTHHAAEFNRLLKEAGARPPEVLFREVSGFSPALAMELDELVARGAYVVVAGDRTPIESDARKGTVRVPFFGEPARFPTGGALLALLLKCPLRQMTCTRTASASGRRIAYRVRFDSIEEMPSASRAERAERLEGWVAKYAANLERELARSPYDWFNFYDFWKA